MLAQQAIEPFPIEAEVADARLAEFHVRIAETARHVPRMVAGDRQQVVARLDADHPSRRTYGLARAEAELARTRAEREHGLSRPEIRRRIAASFRPDQEQRRDGGRR